MKALIISDIHSNIYALEAIWAQERDSDMIYCAGDLVDYGPAIPFLVLITVAVTLAWFEARRTPNMVRR